MGNVGGVWKLMFLWQHIRYQYTDSEYAAIKTLASILHQRCPPTETPTDVPATAPTPMETIPPSETSSPTTLHQAPTPNDNPRTTATVRPYPTSFGDIEERYYSIIIDANGEEQFDTNRLLRRRKKTPPAPVPEKYGKEFTILRPPDTSDLVPPAQLTCPGSKVTIIAQPGEISVFST